MPVDQSIGENCFNWQFEYNQLFILFISSPHKKNDKIFCDSAGYWSPIHALLGFFN